MKTRFFSEQDRIPGTEPNETFVVIDFISVIS